MLTSEEQMQIIKDAITSGYKGPIFKLIDEGHIQKSQIATTENQQEQGLRGSDGNTAMAFPESSGDFNTQGMDFDVDIRKYDNQGNLVRSYNKVPPGVQNLQMGEEEGTVIETPSQYQDGGFYPNPNQPVNIQVDNEKKRREQEKRNDIELKAKIDKEQTEIYSNMLDPINVADAVGMTGIPVISEAGDLVSAGISTARGNYTDASLSMAGIAVPFAGGAALKHGKKTYNVMDRNFKGYMKQIDNREDLVKEYNKRNNVYRTDNITGPVIKNKELTDAARHYGFDPKDPKQMAEFLGTTPTRGSGNRAGWSGSWGGSDIKYYGNYPGQTLNRYGLAPSRNAFTTKVNLFGDDIAKLSDNQLYDRISALDAQSMHNPNLNIFETARDVGKLDNLPHGAIINTNTIHPPGIDVTSQLVGRTNIPIRQSKGVLSADEVRQLTNYGKNPFATFQEGGFNSNKEKPKGMMHSTPVHTFPTKREELNTAIDRVVGLENESDRPKIKKMLQATNFVENSMGNNPKAYGRKYTNSQASIDPIMFTDLFSPKIDDKGKSQGFTTTQKKHFKRLEELGLPSDSTKFKEELQADNPLAATYAMRMVYGKSPKSIPEVGDTAKAFKYYNDNYRKNNKITDLTESKKRFYEGYKSKFQIGGIRKYHEGGTADQDHIDMMNMGTLDAHNAEGNTGGNTGDGTGVGEWNPATGMYNAPEADVMFKWNNQDGFGVDWKNMGAGLKKAANWGREVWDKSSTLGKVGIGLTAGIPAAGLAPAIASDWSGFKNAMGFQKGGFNFNKNSGKGYYSPEAIKERQKNKKINWENLELGAGFAPYLGEVIDAKNTIKDLRAGNYGGAALNATGFMIPFVPGGAIKRGFKKLFGKKTPITTAITKNIPEYKLPVNNQKLLGHKKVYRAVKPELADNIMKPLDLTLTDKVASNGVKRVQPEANLAWFGPNKGAYDESGKQLFEASLKWKNPYHIDIDEVWSSEKLQKIKDAGHDIIIAGSDQYSQIPLDKNVIQNLKRIRQTGGLKKKCKYGCW
jgi:hypothetical protein